MATLPDPDSIRGIAYGIGQPTREVLTRVTMMIKAHGHTDVIMEDDRDRPANAVLQRWAADSIRRSFDVTDTDINEATDAAVEWLERHPAAPAPDPTPQPLVSYGSWRELIGTESPEAHVRQAVEAYRAGMNPEPDIDFGRACQDFRQTIGWTLPQGVELIGSLFYGEPDATFPGYAQSQDGALDLPSIIQLIAVDVIVERRRIRETE